MSPTSVASEYFRYFTGIASISFNMPFRSLLAHKNCRQYNSPVNSGIMMVVIVVFSPWRKCGQKALWRTLRMEESKGTLLDGLMMIAMVRVNKLCTIVFALEQVFVGSAEKCRLPPSSCSAAVRQAAPTNKKCTISRKVPNYLERYASLEPRKRIGA
eukprot:scaffold2641_cov110-Skeletonema_dohrnii-CCMP3373.AAC.12